MPLYQVSLRANCSNAGLDPLRTGFHQFATLERSPAGPLRQLAHHRTRIGTEAPASEREQAVRVHGIDGHGGVVQLADGRLKLGPEGLPPQQQRKAGRDPDEVLPTRYAAHAVRDGLERGAGYAKRRWRCAPAAERRGETARSLAGCL